MVHLASCEGLAKMIAAANVLISGFLSLVALLGLLTLRWVLIRQGDRDPINRRFLFGVRVLMLLFIGRLLLILTGVVAFRIFVLLGAALIPLAVLLLTEGLLRRHAPHWAKALIAGGTILFATSAFWYSGTIDPVRLTGLLGFQITGFCVSGWLILQRDRSSLSFSENTMVARLALSLLLFIPLAIGDFFADYFGLPVQFSSLGVLVLCWLAIGLARSQIGHRETLLILLVMTCVSVVSGGLIGLVVNVDGVEVLMIVALIFAVIVLAAIVQDARSLLSEERSIGLLRHMATARTEDPVAFLRDLRAHPLVDGAVVVHEDSLRGLDPKTLDAIFETAPVLRRASPPSLGHAADDHITHLFAHYSATHIFLARDAPRVLIALSMPSLGLSPHAELELEVVQRMAALIARQDASAVSTRGTMDG